jgi:uncharacterized iron-regulated membrane protein
VVLPPLSTPSARNTLKDFHRLRAFGAWALVVTVLFGLSVTVLIVTGAVLYWRLLAARLKLGRKTLFWSAGGWWRTLHRAVAVVAMLFLLVVALSGIVLASSSVGVAISQAMHGGKRPGLTADVSAPLTDAELPAMLRQTLTAFHARAGAAQIKVLRLRHFAGMDQGVVVAGGDDVRQFAFNAADGRPAGISGPGYPNTDMPFGWQIDQLAKRIHRGDIIGLSGRCMDLLAGLSLLYLSVSGAVMYVDLWSRRRKMGRHGLFWS